MAEDSHIQILIQIDKTYIIDVKPFATIQYIKSEIEDQCGIHTGQQRLIFHSKELRNNKTLYHYNIAHLSVINMVQSFSKLSPISLKIVQYGKISSVDCDACITMEEVLKKLDKTYHELEAFQVSVIHKHFNYETILTISQIETEPIYNIPHLLDEQIIVINNIRSFQQRTGKSQFISDLSMSFINSDKKHEAYTYIEFDIITKIISSMKIRKPNDPLLLISAECLLHFSGCRKCCNVPEAVNKYMISPILDILSDRNNFNDEIYRTLLRCMINILCANKRFLVASHKEYCLTNGILHKLIKFADPCGNREIIVLIAKIFKSLCSSQGILDDIYFSITLKLLYILMYYEDDVKTIERAAIGFSSWILSSRSNIPAIDAIFYGPDGASMTIQTLYKNKQQKNRLIFNGYIQQSLMHSNIAFLPSDIVCIILNYYDCYKNIKIDIAQRLMCLSGKQNGYGDAVRNAALSFLTRITQFCSKMLLNSLLSRYNILTNLNNILIIKDEGINIHHVYWILNNMSYSDYGYLLSSDIIKSMIDRWYDETLINCNSAVCCVVPLFHTIERIVFDYMFDEELKAIIMDYKIIKYIFIFFENTMTWDCTVEVGEAMHKALDFMERLLHDESFSDICKAQIIKYDGTTILKRITIYPGYFRTTQAERATIFLRDYFDTNNVNEELEKAKNTPLVDHPPEPVSISNVEQQINYSFKDEINTDQFIQFSFTDGFSFTGGGDIDSSHDQVDSPPHINVNNNESADLMTFAIPDTTVVFNDDIHID